MRLVRAVAAAACAAMLGACSLMPAFKRPQVDVPAAWKVEPGWRESKPADTVPKGQWWLRFGDADLNALIDKALTDSPTLALAGARLKQARANVEAATASLFPQVSLAGREQRFKISANRALTNYAAPQFGPTQTEYQLTLGVNYEADVFGRVQSTVAGARASAEQSASDLENTKLLLTTDLATAYFNLRQVDLEIDVLTRSIGLQNRSLGLVTSRHDLGAASGLDVAQQRALIDNTLTQVDLLRRQRVQFENAIATLTGTPAPAFSLKPMLTRVPPPEIPVGVPSDLLERRPDVASAERAVEVANAQIGIARAAFYPSIIIAPFYGYQSRTSERFFDYPSTIWSLGMSVVQPIFTFGRLKANLEAARAGHEATVANYRRVVLTAMQEVEDGILGGAALDRAHVQAIEAVKSAGRVLELANTRYEGGVSTYLDVITAQQSFLNAERLVTQLQGQRLLVSVFLIKALGGDYPQ